MYVGSALLVLLLLVCFGTLRGQEVDDVEYYFHNGSSSSQKLLRNRLPCSCQSYTCGCCAGMNIQAYNFSQNACLNLMYDPYEFSVTSNMLMNDNSMFTYTFTAKNPPAVCTPVPLLLLPTLVHMCVRVFNIFTPGSNLHLCVDFEARIANRPVVILHFDCLRVGADGFVLLKPEDEGGLKPTPPPALPGDDEYDEITEERATSTSRDEIEIE
jgi:hypothetical protein